MEKKTGIVVPLSALYTKDCEAIGDFLALKPFADFCCQCNLKVIQLLPVNDTGTQSSPYSGLSAFALHPVYIRLEALPEFEIAYKKDKSFTSAYNAFKKSFKYSSRFDYTAVLNEKTKLLHLLYSYVEKQIEKESKKTAGENKGKLVVGNNGQASFSEKFFTEIDAFIRENSWIETYAVYKNLKDTAMQASWKQWDEQFQHMNREQIKLRWNNRALKSSHNFFVWCQLRASQQFKEAADYVREKDIVLKGDIPILMNEDSADAWAWPEYFSHDLRAGSPPDGENPMGQNWGFPTYNWKNLEIDNFSWWKTRINVSAKYYSAFRIDHILGFFRIWAADQHESTAFLGHTMPYKDFGKKDLEEIGFDQDRINWLSKPHIPTGLIEDITWNHDEATQMLEKICDRVKSEELWNFKPTVKSDAQIYSEKFSDDERKDWAVKVALVEKWRDRTLIEIEEGRFIPVYSHDGATSWKSLNWEEQQKLNGLFAKVKDEEMLLWKEQALKVLTPIVGASGMVPCAEDLGVNLECMPEVLSKLDIMSLRVIRWCRDWSAEGQPYVEFEQYPEMSVATTSVHDSPTLRQWWTDEKQSVEAYLKQWDSKEENPLFKNLVNFSAGDDFSPSIAQFCLESAAMCKSAWFVNPLQDYLFLDESYYLENPQDERINVPGSVNEFNWTYRIPCLVDDLAKNEKLISKIKSVVAIHEKNISGEVE